MRSGALSARQNSPEMVFYTRSGDRRRAAGWTLFHVLYRVRVYVCHRILFTATVVPRSGAFDATGTTQVFFRRKKPSAYSLRRPRLRAGIVGAS